MTGQPLKPVVLLVEDSEDDTFFFRWTLRKCEVPCELLHAADGVEAVRAIEERLESNRLPHLLFLDLKLPNMNGFEVLAWIRERGLENRFEMTVLSGSDQNGDLARARELGATRYIVKPISADQLRRQLEDCHAALQASEPVHKTAGEAAS